MKAIEGRGASRLSARHPRTSATLFGSAALFGYTPPRYGVGLMFQDVEKVLLDGARELQRGRTPNVKQVYEALERVTPRDTNLAPLVAFFLKSPEDDLPISAANALARLKDAARPYVPELIELSKSDRLYPAGAATAALGALATPQAITALIDALDRHPRHGLNFVIGALEFAGTAAVPALGSLTRLLRDESVSSGTRYHIRTTLQAIYTAARYEHSLAAQAAGLFEYIPIARPYNGSAYEHFAPYAIPIDAAHEGLIHRGRFHFNTRTTARNEIGLEIFGRPDGAGNVVVFTSDARSFGVSSTNAVEDLATAIMQMYGLDPTKTVFIENYGLSAGFDEEAHKEVTFEFDPQEGSYSRPEWRRSPSLRQLLREFGIER